MTMRLKKVARAKYRIGVQTLYVDRDTGQHYLEILNRTYHSIVPCPEEKVELWKSLLENDS